MDDTMFKELLASLKEAIDIKSGKKKTSRVFEYQAKNSKDFPKKTAD